MEELIIDPNDPRSLAAKNRQGPFPGEEMENGIRVVDRLLEFQSIVHFAESIAWNQLPNGKPFSQPVLEDAVFLLSTPYSEWAPHPYRRIEGSAFDKISIRIGSHEDSDRLAVAPQPLIHLKSRLWEGVVPISDQRWRDMQLDDAKHHRMACEHLGSALQVFEYLNSSPYMDDLRTTYNLISEHIQEFEDAVNAQRSAKGEEPVSMTGLWAEYMTAQYQVTIERSHAWILRHASRALQRIIDEIRNSRNSDTTQYSREQLDLTNRFHDMMEIIARADCMVFIPMTGYKDFVDPTYPPLYHRQQQDRFDAHMARVRQQTGAKMLANIQAGRDPGEPRNSANSLAIRCIEQKEAHDDVRLEMRGNPETALSEPWTRTVLRRLETDADGEPDLRLEPDLISFVVYRLTYKHSDEEWNQFKQKLEANVADWGDGIQGSENLKSMMNLHWVDGKDQNIAEGDIEAARKHFDGLRDTPEKFPKGSTDRVFIVIDADSVSSYLSPSIPSSRSCPGDDTGFVIAVDADFDSTKPDEYADESPGFDGSMRILGSLIWSDLLALDEAQTLGPRELWPSALEQPDRIYVGPVVQWMRNRWAGKV